MPSLGRTVLGGGSLEPRHDRISSTQIFSFVTCYSVIGMGTLKGVNLTELGVVLS